MSLSEAIQKVFNFLSEYDSLYCQEDATLAVSEQLMVDAEEFLDQFEDMFLDRDVTSSRNKQRCILDPCFTKKHSVKRPAD